MCSGRSPLNIVPLDGVLIGGMIATSRLLLFLSAECKVIVQICWLKMIHFINKIDAIKY